MIISNHIIRISYIGTIGRCQSRNTVLDCYAERSLTKEIAIPILLDSLIHQAWKEHQEPLRRNALGLQFFLITKFASRYQNPRIRGGTSGKMYIILMQLGTSPHTRGNPGNPSHERRGGRTIPAYAGEPLGCNYLIANGSSQRIPRHRDHKARVIRVFDDFKWIRITFNSAIRVGHFNHFRIARVPDL